MKRKQWHAIRAIILKLAINLGNYAVYLEKQGHRDLGKAQSKTKHFLIQTPDLLTLSNQTS